MKGCGVVFVALHIDRNALFNYKNFFSKPEALFELTLCVGRFDRYGVHACEVSIVLPRHQKLFYVLNSCRRCGKSRQSDSLAACAALESDMAHIFGFERSQLLLLPETVSLASKSFLHRLLTASRRTNRSSHSMVMLKWEAQIAIASDKANKRSLSAAA